jgi:hypothetical protein
MHYEGRDSKKKSVAQLLSFVMYFEQKQQSLDQFSKINAWSFLQRYCIVTENMSEETSLTLNSN